MGVEVIQWLAGRRQRYRVTGISMVPTLLPGDHLLVDECAYDDGLPVVGDIVVARHPFADHIVVIKRVTACDGGWVWLGSDNPRTGMDSRHFGPVALTLLVGHVTLCFRS